MNSSIRIWRLLVFLINSFDIIQPLVAETTITARTCSQADVRTAINSANNNDTVVIPAGNCTGAPRFGWMPQSRISIYWERIRPQRSPNIT